MDRTDRADRVIAAPPATVYDALLDRESEAWLPPDGMRGRIERWDSRPGGGFRMVLTHLDPAGSPGRTSNATDVVDVGFAHRVPSVRVVQRAVFEADDPSYAGTMTMTWHLAAADDGTEVTVRHRHGRPTRHRPSGTRGRNRLLTGQPGLLRRRGRLTRTGCGPGPERACPGGGRADVRGTDQARCGPRTERELGPGLRGAA